MIARVSKLRADVRNYTKDVERWKDRLPDLREAMFGAYTQMTKAATPDQLSEILHGLDIYILEVEADVARSELVLRQSKLSAARVIKASDYFNS